MILEAGHTYECKNGTIVTVKRSNLPYYKFSVAKIDGVNSDDTEKWTEDGIAYHDDCGFNFVREVLSLKYEKKLTVPGRGEVCVGLLSENCLTLDTAVGRTVFVEDKLYIITSVEHRGDDGPVGFIVRPKKIGMMAYKVELLIIDFDEVGEKDIKSMIENVRYPNYCIHPSVMNIESKDIGEWSDDHPLNHRDKMRTEYERLFK